MKALARYFTGAGKSGGGEVRTPREAPNTLRSRAFVRFVEAISEGPIEGFVDANGVLLQNAVLNVQPTLSVDGRLTYASSTYDLVYDDSGSPTTSAFRVYGVLSATNPRQNLPLIPIQGQGYPFGVNAGEISCEVSGKFKSDAGDNKGPATVKLLVYPRTAAEQLLTAKNITYNGHGFSSGDYVQRYIDGGVTYWVKIDPSDIPLHHEVRRVTNVVSANIFEGVIAEIYTEGKAYGLYVFNRGFGYESAKVYLPASIAQAIFFDGTPLADSENLEYNFTNVRLDFRNGDEYQTPLDGFEQTETLVDTTQSPTIIKKSDGSAAVVKTISGDWDQLVISLILPEGLYRQDLTNGDISGIGIGYDDSGQAPAGVTSNDNIPPIIRITQRLVIGNTEGVEQPFGPNNGVVVIKGKTMSAYEVSVQGSLIKPPGTHFGNYSYRLSFYRLSKNDSEYSNPSARRTTVAVSTITGVVNARMSYPFCAVVGMELDAEQFSSIPVRSYRVRGLRVPVPTNYFPPYSIRRRTVNGVVHQDYRQYAEYNRLPSGDAVYDPNGNPVEQPWDGTFYESWTDNPAYLTHAICTEARIGLGDVIPGANKWLFYRVARYCDELLDAGWDGSRYTQKEPRFRCSAYLQTAEEAWKVLTDLCSSFAGYCYYAGGTVIPVQDRPRTSRLSFTPANVENGVFMYQGTHRNGRYSAVVVRYNDPSSEYRLQPIVLQDDELMGRIGWRPLVRTAFGCTSIHQARRYARRVMRTSLSLTESVKFTTGLLGSILRPGDVFEVYDPSRSSVPFGGRITEVYRAETGVEEESNVIALDRKIPLETLNLTDLELFRSYGLVCQCPKGVPSELEITSEEELARLLDSQLTHPLRIKGFSTNAAGHTTVILDEAIPAGVEVGMIWGLRRSDVHPQKFQCMGVEETGKHRFEVFGIEYQDALYNAVDFDSTYVEPPINPDLDAWKRPHPIRNLRLLIVPKLGADGQRIYILNASWTPPAKGFAREYYVELRRSIGNYQFATSTPLTNVELPITEPDYYCVRVRTVGLSGTMSEAVESCTVVGVITGDNQEIISGLELTGQANETVFVTGDASFDWRINWSEATSEFQTEVPTVLPPGVTDYEVTLYDVDMNQVWVGSRRDSSFQLSVDQNRSLPSGPYREFIIGVQARTTSGGLSKETRLRVSNTKPPVPTFTHASDVNGFLLIKFTPSILQDFSHFNVWLSETEDFVPDDTNLKFSGDLSIASIELTPGVTYYFRVAALDVLAKNALDCNISDEYSIVGNRVGTLTVFDFVNSPWT